MGKRKIATFKVGDTVAFARHFLRNTFDYSHAKASLRGVVVEVADMDQWQLCRIDWTVADGTVQTRSVIAPNLVHADRIHLEAH
jgi:hypothetical protein